MRYMMQPRWIRQATLFIFLAVLAVPAISAGKAPPLVSTQWLEDHLQDQNLLILDVRADSNYNFAHIPGAVGLAYKNWETPRDTGCLLAAPEADLTSRLQALGLNNDSHVVVYAHGNTASDASKAAAVFWILQAMGHDNVSMLNGGFTKWTFEGRVVDNKKPAPSAGNFVARKDPSKIATFEDVKKAIKDGSAVFVDARSSVQYFGHEKRADVECYGHIPYAFTLPGDFMTNAGINRAPATIKDKKTLAKMVKGIGLPRNHNTQIIVYCNTAQLAGLDYLVLHNILGYRNVKVYDGSMLEYCKVRGDLPAVRFTWAHGR